MSEQDRKDLLRLHEACKATKKTHTPYEFDWLTELLHAPSQNLRYSTTVDVGRTRRRLRGIARRGFRDRPARLAALVNAVPRRLIPTERGSDAQATRTLRV